MNVVRHTSNIGVVRIGGSPHQQNHVLLPNLTATIDDKWLRLPVASSRSDRPTKMLQPLNDILLGLEKLGRDCRKN
jgi:hypothetical protein